MTSNDAFSRINRWFKNSISLKFFTIGILVLLLLIPAAMVQDLIRERQHSQNSTIREVHNKWGSYQLVNGPVLTIPYYVYHTEGEKTFKTMYYAHFLPDELSINGELFTQNLHRGIYDVTVYNSQLDIKGSFPKPDFTALGIASEYVDWSLASLNIGITDMRGIRENIKLQWDTAQYDFEPGVESEGVLGAGVSSRVAINESQGNHSFAFQMNLNGSQQLHFVPVGKQTLVDLKSKWPNPSFDGAFLPETRDVQDSSFTAQWKVLHVNRNFPQQWKGNQELGSAAFGLSLLSGVDQYQKSTRSAKYAVLIIVLTFLTYFFIEITQKIRIHSVQYLLVGIALCVFYTLLISISEHLGFTLAYVIAGIATVLLVTSYTSAIVKNMKITLFTGGTLSALYFFVFILLQEQDYALLMGSIGLFLILGLVMYFSKRIKWYDDEEVNTKSQTLEQ